MRVVVSLSLLEFCCSYTTIFNFVFCCWIVILAYLALLHLTKKHQTKQIMWCFEIDITSYPFCFECKISPLHCIYFLGFCLFFRSLIVLDCGFVLWFLDGLLLIVLLSWFLGPNFGLIETHFGVCEFVVGNWRWAFGECGQCGGIWLEFCL